MRVTSEFWVTALLRRVFSDGGFASIVRRGAAEAGAVFVLARGRDGTSDLLAPAPQAGYGESRPDERLFALEAEAADEETVARRMEREARFDPDFWVVEIEIGPRPVTDYLRIVGEKDVSPP